MNMAKKMKEKAIPATSVTRSNEIVKTITQAEKVELFRQLEPIANQNKREHNAGIEAIEKDGSYYKGNESIEKTFIKMEEFYEFLCSNPSDDLTTIRKMFMYYRNFINSYQFTVAQFDEEFVFTDDGWKDRAFLEKAHQKYQLMNRLTHDSYLAILLHRLDYETYKNIIKGLYCYFEYSDAKINPPLKGTNYKTETYALTKEQYIQSLIYSQHVSTNVGDYIDTSSLGSIIEFEKDLIKDGENIECLRLTQRIPYDGLKIFKQRN